MAAAASGAYFMCCVRTFQPGLAQDTHVQTETVWHLHTRWQNPPEKYPSYDHSVVFPKLQGKTKNQYLWWKHEERSEEAKEERFPAVPTVLRFGEQSQLWSSHRSCCKSGNLCYSLHSETKWQSRAKGLWGLKFSHQKHEPDSASSGLSNPEAKLWYKPYLSRAKCV